MHVVKYMILTEAMIALAAGTVPELQIRPFCVGSAADGALVAVASLLFLFLLLPGGGVPGKLQHGSAWWFNDNRPGMRAQLTDLACNGVLGRFVGMLTDSRSFLSYTRHEYFRRILCELVGEWVESGQYPNDETGLAQLIADICFHNTNEFFRFQV